MYPGDNVSWEIFQCYKKGPPFFWRKLKLTQTGYNDTIQTGHNEFYL